MRASFLKSEKILMKINVRKTYVAGKEKEAAASFSFCVIPVLIKIPARPCLRQPRLHRLSLTWCLKYRYR